MALARLQIALGGMGAARDRLERWLEAERDQLFLWTPVALGAGSAAWFALPDPRQWLSLLALLAAVVAGALAMGGGGRAARALALAAGLAALGLMLAWSRAERVRAPVLARPTVAAIEARVARIETQVARGTVRLRLIAARRTDGRSPALPETLRVTIDAGDLPPLLSEGARIALRARLVPPPEPAVPGAYDFARVAWFDGIGATGRGFAPLAITAPGARADGPRAALGAHIRAALSGSAGGIAVALATGDQGAIAAEDAEALRRAGLAHLLSVSGLHITAVVGATMIAVLRLLALWPWLALRLRLPLVAAGAAAVAAVGYTWLTGAEVPTIRSCVAALLVLLAIALGREAVTLRLVAAGALVVLALWPEAVVGPSFQLSFAAVAAIVALHETPWLRAWLSGAGDAPPPRWRALAGVLLTGLVVEAALAPIGLFHFHRAGLYGALANIVAIPLTTFVVMPLEAAALALDLIGLGAPLWWLCGRALALLLAIAHATAALPGAVAMLPTGPVGGFALSVIGGLWLALWRTRARLLGLVPFLLGLGWAALTPPPDVIVTGDGRHVALRVGDTLALLRPRAGDYVRQTLAESAGVAEAALSLDELGRARCSADACVAGVRAGGRRWVIMATRSLYPLPRAPLLAACAGADIVVSERRLPRACQPRWLKLDAPALRQTGGVALDLGAGRVTTVKAAGDAHPWRMPTVRERPSR